MSSPGYNNVFVVELPTKDKV